MGKKTKTATADRHTTAYIRIQEIRTGTQLLYKVDQTWMPTTLDWQDLRWMQERPEEFLAAHRPITLTEDVVLAIQRKTKLDTGAEFDMIPARSERFENTFQSRTLSGDQILILTPYYEKQTIGKRTVKNLLPTHFDCALHDSRLLKRIQLHIPGGLRYFHQLQGLVYTLTSIEYQIDTKFLV